MTPKIDVPRRYTVKVVVTIEVDAHDAAEAERVARERVADVGGIVRSVGKVRDWGRRA